MKKILILVIAITLLAATGAFAARALVLPLEARRCFRSLEPPTASHERHADAALSQFPLMLGIGRAPPRP